MNYTASTSHSGLEYIVSRIIEMPSILTPKVLSPFESFVTCYNSVTIDPEFAFASRQELNALQYNCTPDCSKTHTLQLNIPLSISLDATFGKMNETHGSSRTSF